MINKNKELGEQELAGVNGGWMFYAKSDAETNSGNKGRFPHGVLLTQSDHMKNLQRVVNDIGDPRTSDSSYVLGSIQDYNILPGVSIKGVTIINRKGQEVTDDPVAQQWFFDRFGGQEIFDDSDYSDYSD